MTSVPPGTKLGRYEVVKPLASGGMAELLLARTAPAERPLVLKWLRPEQAIDGAFVEVFVQEGRRAAQLHHPNIVEVHEVGREDGTHYLAMEYIHGDDLRKLLARLHERRAKLPVQHILAICTSVAQALHHAHEQLDGDGKPALHLGIKPANVIITSDGTVKLADFGVGRAALTEGRTDLLSAIAGYLSPEQCLGQPVDRRSDIFALGILMYELSVGRRLFKGDSDFATMAAIVAGDVPPPAKHRGDLPKDLEALILKALARSPDDRFQTAQELHTALDKFATKAGVRGSLTTLSGYTKRLFGVRPEPWLTADEATDATSNDFDGAPKGLAIPPPEAASCSLPSFVVAGDEAPIMRVKKLVSRDMPTEQLNIGSKPIPDRSTPVKIPSTVNGAPNGVRALPKPLPNRPTPVPVTPRAKPKTVQIPLLADEPTQEKTDVLATRDISFVDKDEVTKESIQMPVLAEDTVPAAPKLAPPPPVRKPILPVAKSKPIVSLEASSVAGEIKSRPQSAREQQRVDTEVDALHLEATAVSTPPPMPIVAMTVARENTEHVKPLSAIAVTAVASPSRRGKPWLLLGGIVAVAAAAALVIGLGLVGGSDPSPSTSGSLAAPAEPTPEPAVTPPPEEHLRTADTPRTPRNSGVTSDDPKPEAPATVAEPGLPPTEPEVAEPVAEPEVAKPVAEPVAEPEVKAAKVEEPPPPPKFVEPKDPSPPDEPVVVKPRPVVKPKSKPAAIAQKPKPKPVAAKPKPTTKKSKPTTAAKPAGKWDPNALFPK